MTRRRQSGQKLKKFFYGTERSMIKKEATIACAKLRDALCFIKFMLEQMSAALSTCSKKIKEGCEPKKTLLIRHR